MYFHAQRLSAPSATWKSQPIQVRAEPLSYGYPVYVRRYIHICVLVSVSRDNAQVSRYNAHYTSHVNTRVQLRVPCSHLVYSLAQARLSAMKKGMAACTQSCQSVLRILVSLSAIRTPSRMHTSGHAQNTFKHVQLLSERWQNVLLVSRGFGSYDNAVECWRACARR